MPALAESTGERGIVEVIIVLDSMVRLVLPVVSLHPKN
jgi:hypothetical protein